MKTEKEVVSKKKLLEQQLFLSPNKYSDNAISLKNMIIALGWVLE